MGRSVLLASCLMLALGACKHAPQTGVMVGGLAVVGIGGFMAFDMSIGSTERRC